jgi:hypothetical protein
MTTGLLIGLVSLTVAVLILTNRYRTLWEERQDLANELDMWKSSGMHYFRAYPRFAEWPDKHFEGREMAEIDRLYQRPEGCRVCGTEDTGRMTPESQVCIDCADDDRNVWPAHSQFALIVDDVFVWRYADGTRVTPEPADYCQVCTDELRMKEHGGSLCSSCSRMAIHWYTKPLDSGFDHTGAGWWSLADKRPHEALVSIGHYNDYDYINHWTHEWVPIPEAVEILDAGERGDFDERIAVKYLPPVQGPREGNRAPVFRSDFAPLPAGADDDIPF